VVGPGDVVADSFGRVTTDEDRARVADAFDKRLRFVKRELDVLGGEAVGERDSLARGSRR
jgi:hypothetical protein